MTTEGAIKMRHLGEMISGGFTGRIWRDSALMLVLFKRDRSVAVFLRSSHVNNGTYILSVGDKSRE